MTSSNPIILIDSDTESEETMPATGNTILEYMEESEPDMEFETEESPEEEELEEEEEEEEEEEPEEEELEPEAEIEPEPEPETENDIETETVKPTTPIVPNSPLRDPYDLCPYGPNGYRTIPKGPAQLMNPFWKSFRKDSKLIRKYNRFSPLIRPHVPPNPTTAPLVSQPDPNQPSTSRPSTSIAEVFDADPLRVVSRVEELEDMVSYLLDRLDKLEKSK